MPDYSDCVLKRKFHNTMIDKSYCQGLTELMCETRGHCPFYGSRETHYCERKTRHIKLKGGTHHV